MDVLGDLVVSAKVGIYGDLNSDKQALAACLKLILEWRETCMDIASKHDVSLNKDERKKITALIVRETALGELLEEFSLPWEPEKDLD